MMHIAGYSSSEDEEEVVMESPAVETVPVSSRISKFDRMIKYIPMRLNEDERMMLKVLENALEVCGKWFACLWYQFLIMCP